MKRATLNRINEIMNHSRDNVDFYKRHFRGHKRNLKSLEDFKGFPIVTDHIFMREELSDLITGLNDVCETRYPFDSLKMDSQLIRVLNGYDVESEYNVLKFIAKQTGTYNKIPYRIMLLADEKHNYSIGEFGKKIAFWETPLAMLLVRDQSTSELKHILHNFSPNLLFAALDKKISDAAIPDSVSHILTFNNQNTYSSLRKKTKFQYFDIFNSPLMGNVAIRNHKDNFYSYDPLQFYIEDENNQLIFTSFKQKLQPIVRYKSGDCGKALEPGKFILTYRGEH